MDAFTVVADPTRRQLLDELRHGERHVGELVEALGLSQPRVSKHLRILRDSGVVACRVEAQHRRYRVEPEGLRAIDDWIAAYRQLWTGRLDALEAHLDRTREEKP
ncbi:MAG TPA: metalloregulator ArsR/SmtB family transcription factor [Acidimicrobiales bacterium]|nr:metalloregulator ArsR/SmtB family transcription factor [Acidimicrobiales bacterium]